MFCRWKRGEKGKKTAATDGLPPPLAGGREGKNNPPAAAAARGGVGGVGGERGGDGLSPERHNGITALPRPTKTFIELWVVGGWGSFFVLFYCPFFQRPFPNFSIVLSPISPSGIARTKGREVSTFLFCPPVPKIASFPEERTEARRRSQQVSGREGGWQQHFPFFVKGEKWKVKRLSGSLEKVPVCGRCNNIRSVFCIYRGNESN